MSCSISMDENGAMSDSTSQNPNSSLAIFCREVRNLLRSKPNCIIPFSKFVPAYHNHYGRQCCVYQFGYTKLIELLEAIPHVVQILTDGTNRYITLTHREQIKRFASDLIKVVKSQPGKRLTLSQFGEAYERVLARTFRVEDYGTNNINVLLAEIWEGTINIIPIKRETVEAQLIAAAEEQSGQQEDELDEENDSLQDSSYSSNGRQQRQQQQWLKRSLRPLYVNVPLPKNNPILEQLVAANELVNEPYITAQHPDCWFEIPRRERSEKEIKRTKYFIWDCIELLSRMKQQNYAVPFSKFIPAYHYYFNRQCKVSIFGFSKLIDLFESISPNVVEIIDQGPGEEKLIKLCQKYWPKQTPGRPIKPARRTIMSSTSPIIRRSLSPQYDNKHRPAKCQQQSQRSCVTPSRTHVHRDSLVEADECDEQEDDVDDDDEFELESEEEEVDVEEEEQEDENEDVEEDEDQEEEEEEDEEDDGQEDEAEDMLDEHFPTDHQPIDSGPSEEELLELEHELEAYEELQAIQRKRSGRMAAILDIFKYSIY